MLNIKNIKITPEQLDEIQMHLEIIGEILNRESAPEWEDLQTACRNIFDAKQNLCIIRNNAEIEVGVSAKYCFNVGCMRSAEKDAEYCSSHAPYLKPSSECKPEKIGNVRI